MRSKRRPNAVLPDGRHFPDFDGALRAFVASLLAERQLSETQLAQQVGISQQNVNRFMRGGATTLHMLARICVWTGKDPNAALGYKGVEANGVRSTIKTLARLAALDDRIDVAEWLLTTAAPAQTGGKD